MKSTSIFHFKQFSVNHENSALKVGTDAVLLGAWTHVDNAQNILDVGTGSGVIALMIAQRSSNTTKIEAVEINPIEAEIAQHNFMNSPWSSRLEVHAGRIQTFSSNHGFDLIVSNPPYFVKSLKPHPKNRIQAKHTDSLSYEDLCVAVSRLLNRQGRFSVILPANESGYFQAIALNCALFCFRKTLFRTRAHNPVKRVLMEFGTAEGPCDQDELVLYGAGLDLSAPYSALTGQYYLKVTK